jgi:hypothetical protein
LLDRVDAYARVEQHAERRPVVQVIERQEVGTPDHPHPPFVLPHELGERTGRERALALERYVHRFVLGSKRQHGEENAHRR